MNSSINRNGLLVVVNLAAMSDLDDQNTVRRFDPVDDSVIPHTKASRTLQAVTEWFSKFDGVRCKSPLNGLLDSSLNRFGESRDILPGNALQVFETILQSQALSCDTRFVFFAIRSSAIREKCRSS